jgi:pimeloyl-ACP methyl ester carboxylesterase
VDRPAVSARLEAELVSQKPFLVYLEGGPGFGNQAPQDKPLTKHFLDRGYQLLFLDYRGTGLSTPVNAKHVTQLGDAAAQADYLKLFRQDNIVRDCEAVRLCLTKDFPTDKRQWSIIGQSFGGFVSLTYLSKYPESLRESFICGGLAPVGKTPDEVYEATFKKVIDRNFAYYKKFPEDIDRVKHIVSHIANSEGGAIALPSGGFLTVGRFLSVGILFGMHGGLNMIHGQVLKMAADLNQFGFFSRSSLVAFEQILSFDIAPIYAVLHEAIYCYKPGIASNWAAQRVGSKLEEFSWLREPRQAATQEPIFFAGEMVFPFHFDIFPELMGLKDAAELLANFDQWEELYDEEKLRKNEYEVPVYAASFIEDMYVDFELARETAKMVGGIKVFETNSLYHNALRAKADEVLVQLCRMRDDPID